MMYTKEGSRKLGGTTTLAATSTLASIVLSGVDFKIYNLGAGTVYLSGTSDLAYTTGYPLASGAQTSMLSGTVWACTSADATAALRIQKYL